MNYKYERKIILKFSEISKDNLPEWKPIHDRFNTKATHLRLQYNPNTEELFVTIVIKARMQYIRDRHCQILKALPIQEFRLQYQYDQRRGTI